MIIKLHEGKVVPVRHWPKKVGFCLLAAALLINGSTKVAAASQQSTLPALMPMPAEVSIQSGSFPIRKSFHIEWQGYKSALLERAGKRFLERLGLRTGILFSLSDVSDSRNAFRIRCDRVDPKFLTLQADESYELQISETEVTLHAHGPTGVLRGLATLLQLVTQQDQGFNFTAVSICDRPRFAWRGLMIDVSRHFMPLPVVERQLNAMEELKMNVLHLHLSDSESFSIESKYFPLLQRKGAANGQYYTQAQIRELIEVAHDRGIRVVPEFDVPGHSRSWFAGYPRLTSPLFSQQNEHSKADAVFDPTNPYCYWFLDRLIGEMAVLFPDRYFHIGGDEVSGKQWRRDQHIVQFMQAHSIKDTASLQAYFTKKVSKIVRSHGKMVIGWDEVLGTDTPSDAVIEVWHEKDLGAKAVQSGHPVIIAGPYYLDSLRHSITHYQEDLLRSVEPTISPKEQNLVLGGEAQMWTEITTPEMLDAALWPRTAAIAERFWSPATVNEIGDMYRRLEVINYELEIMGSQQYKNRRRMIARIDPKDVGTIEAFADVVEPIKGTARWHIMRGLADSPTQNTLADALFPESLTAQVFNTQAQAFVDSGGTDNEQGRMLRGELTRWRDNDGAFALAAKRAQALQVYMSVSQNLSELSSIGLDAMDAIQSRCSPSAAWISNEQAALDRQRVLAAGKPQPPSQVLIAIEPGIEILAHAVEQISDKTCSATRTAQPIID